MFTDARITAAFGDMIRGIDTPPVSLHDIQRRVERPQSLPQQTPHYFRIAIAAVAALIIIAIPFRAPGLVQSVEAQIAAILQWTPPPPAPKPLMSAISSQAHGATLATAQSRVQFTIVPPAGLPKDITSAKIVTIPTGVFTKATRSWRVGPTVVNFIYRRADGRSILLIAHRFDPRDEPPPKYIYDADSLTVRGGHVVLAKHQNFVWRNGNQVMMVVEGNGVSAREIEAIRAAMGGIVIPGGSSWAHAAPSDTIYRIP